MFCFHLNHNHALNHNYNHNQSSFSSIDLELQVSLSWMHIAVLGLCWSWAQMMALWEYGEILMWKVCALCVLCVCVCLLCCLDWWISSGVTCVCVLLSLFTRPLTHLHMWVWVCVLMDFRWCSVSFYRGDALRLDWLDFLVSRCCDYLLYVLFFSRWTKNVECLAS